MTVEQKVLQRAKKVLDLSKLRKSLPKKPRIVRIESEEYVDADGDDALKVSVILSDDTTDEDLSGENVLALKSVVYDSLLDAGITLFPYIFLASQAELDELKREEEEEEG